MYKLTPSEKQSNVTRVKQAEHLISQLPENHDGRNTWLLNYGTTDEACEMRKQRGLYWSTVTEAAAPKPGGSLKRTPPNTSGSMNAVSKLHIRYDRKAVNKYQPFVIDERGDEVEITGLTHIEEVQHYPVQQACEHTLSFINVVCEDVALKRIVEQMPAPPAPFSEFKRGDYLQSVVEEECVVEFYEWADETKTAFHGHLLHDDIIAMKRVKDGWADNWNGAVFVKQPEAPFAEWVK